MESSTCLKADMPTKTESSLSSVATSADISITCDPETAPSTDIPPLDTSPRGWLTVVGGFTCSFASFGWATSIGVFQAYYSTHQLHAYTASAIGWIPSVETAFLFLGVCVFGALFDYLGPTVLLIVGTVLHVGGLLGLANSKTYTQIFVTQSVVSAAGTGAIFVAGATAVGTWFHARRGLALGLVSSGSAVGAVIGTATIPILFEKIGFSWTIRAVALTYFVLMGVAIATISRRPQMGAGTAPPPLRVSQLLPVSLLKSGPVLALAFACFFFNLGFFIPYDYVVVEARDAGATQQSANNLLVILSATRYVPWYIHDFGVTMRDCHQD
ncbi:major facilitator superfamily domain-containing protein [Xylaria bambusicola]|uniref:major facilitator superfamily domain-containing protein n=1 Tax=Xylaria bambusicola TaxID=326684 RepID=UPI00200784D7|nr:major facilitator superfamily domain-containing protein [Xylaria bambusicola]KAI0503186.1 major facilitator superfamily domain-containing protein [Xylaria bambusicola]